MFRRKNSQVEIREALAGHFPRLWRYCVVLTGSRDRADDLAQAACLRALEKAGQFEPGTHLDRWLFRIAQRLWFNDMRKQAVRSRGGLVNVDDIDVPDTRQDTELNILAREVLSQVMALPEAQRLAVMLVYVEEYSYREAADMLEIPIGTVMSRLSAARAKLAEKANRESRVG
jgi:RNA polymerase sigma-70 factor, ECF subfamily